ncbi:MAG: YkgJ family cysteine cluster protein [Desulfobulbaceae bacterium]|jgi:Fe-S-cluster containining protein|nr:YkgJ family cysteine cluster protein [Desulfobulbaceae bacterium]
MTRLTDLAAAVMAIYRDIDEAVTAFQNESGLACPRFCGQCCASDQVEATVIECLPLALSLFAQGLGPATLDTIEALPSQRKHCIFYAEGHESRHSWGCLRYETRPLICRMFGFSGQRDRLNTPRLALCRLMKRAFALGDGDEYRLAVAAAATMPFFSEFAMRLTTLDPAEGATRLPINQAMRRALLKVATAGYLDALKE